MYIRRELLKTMTLSRAVKKLKKENSFKLNCCLRVNEEI